MLENINNEIQISRRAVLIKSMRGAAAYLILPNLSVLGASQASNDFLFDATYVSYNPTNYNPNYSQWPSEQSIRSDLETLLNAGVSGINTYGANNGLKNIPKIAKEMGMKRVIMGIWDIHAPVISGKPSATLSETERTQIRSYHPATEPYEESADRIIRVINKDGQEIPLNRLLKIAQSSSIEEVIRKYSLILYAGKRATASSTPGGLEEWSNAVAAAPFVDGYIAGNEGLYNSSNGGYTFNELQDYHAALRSATGKPVTSSEVDPHYDQAWVLANGDWVSPNIHPFWGGIRNAQDGKVMVENRYKQLLLNSGNRLILIRETGFPTQGEPGLNEALQKEFYQLLGFTSVKFAFFEAFDQPWKNWAPTEPYWGLWNKDRKPKSAVSLLKKQTGVQNCDLYK